MSRLNYHHLRYFREVAIDGQLSRTAARLNLAQSALSIQIKQLEESLGVALFDRVSRKLVLTEAGRIALDHADRIFSSGDQLLATLGARGTFKPPLRVGAASTLSRNFQLQFLRPLLAEGDFAVSLRSGATRNLLNDLKALALDVVLSTQTPETEPGAQFAAQKIAEQPVRLHGRPARIAGKSLRDLLGGEPLILPTETIIRTGFENLIDRLGVTPTIVANVDDMAMVRLLAREDVGLAVAPSVVVADELKSSLLATADYELGISEPFFAVTLARQYPHPALQKLLTA